MLVGFAGAEVDYYGLHHGWPSNRHYVFYLVMLSALGAAAALGPVRSWRVSAATKMSGPGMARLGGEDPSSKNNSASP